MPKNISIKKIIALVNTLAKLHNFCIDREEIRIGGQADPTLEEDPTMEEERMMCTLTLAGQEVPTEQEDATMLESSAQDTFQPMNDASGFVMLQQVIDDDGTPFVVPRQLMDGGEHFDDVPRDIRRNRTMNVDHLPRKALHDKVLNSHKVRPTLNRIRRSQQE